MDRWIWQKLTQRKAHSGRDFVAGGEKSETNVFSWTTVSKPFPHFFAQACFSNLFSAAEFVPQHGAAGFQLSNPSALDMNALVASLEIFNRTTMANIRQRSLALTGYLETLLLSAPIDPAVQERPFSIISPLNPAERGAQLSLRLKPGSLDSIQNALEEHGIVIDERKPDVIRVAPAPLYNTYVDVWEFGQVFLSACTQVAKG